MGTQELPENVSKIFYACTIFCGEDLQAFIKMSKLFVTQKRLRITIEILGTSYWEAEVSKSQGKYPKVPIS